MMFFAGHINGKFVRFSIVEREEVFFEEFPVENKGINLDENKPGFESDYEPEPWETTKHFED